MHVVSRGYTDLRVINVISGECHGTTPPRLDARLDRQLPNWSKRNLKAQSNNQTVISLTVGFGEPT